MLKRYLLLTMSLFLTQINIAQINWDFEENGMGSTEGWNFICQEPTLENEGVNSTSEWSLQVESGNTQGCIFSHVYAVLDTIPDYVDQMVVSVSTRSLGGLSTLSFGKINTEGDLVLTHSDTVTSADWTGLEGSFIDDFQPGEKPAIVLSAGNTVGPLPPEYVLFDNVEFLYLLDNANVVKDLSFALSPNPAQEFLQVQVPVDVFNPTVEVYNLLGRQVYCHPTTVVSGTISLAVGSLPEGSYILRMTDDKQRKSAKKFVVAR